MWLYLIVICSIPVLTQAQSSENFDEITVNSNGYNQGSTNPRIIGNWSMGILDNNGAYADATTNFLDVTNNTLANGGTDLANGGKDHALNVYGAYNVGKTFVMKNTDATTVHFALSSFSIDAGSTTWLAEGYLDGAQVVTQSFTTTNLTPMKVNLTDSKWQNIDEFRIEQKNGEADIYFFLDDITVAPATAITLPVTFPVFKAEVVTQGIQLSWQLGIKDAVKSFTVQRSQDGKTFTDIGSVALSQSADQLNYTYLDQGAQTGINYYRLKLEKSIGGTDDYSQIIQAKKTNTDATEAWRLYPNPIQNQLNISAPKVVQNLITLDIISASGQKVKSVTLSGGKQQWQINLSYLAKGIYFLNLHQNNLVISKLKMIKL